MELLCHRIYAFSPLLVYDGYCFSIFINTCYIICYNFTSITCTILLMFCFLFCFVLEMILIGELGWVGRVGVL